MCDMYMYDMYMLLLIYTDNLHNAINIHIYFTSYSVFLRFSVIFMLTLPFYKMYWSCLIVTSSNVYLLLLKTIHSCFNCIYCRTRLLLMKERVHNIPGNIFIHKYLYTVFSNCHRVCRDLNLRTSSNFIIQIFTFKY